MGIKGDTLRVRFGVTFSMLTVNLQIGDFQLIISVIVWKGMKEILDLTKSAKSCCSY